MQSDLVLNLFPLRLNQIQASRSYSLVPCSFRHAHTPHSTPQLFGGLSILDRLIIHLTLFPYLRPLPLTFPSRLLPPYNQCSLLMSFQPHQTNPSSAYQRICFRAVPYYLAFGPMNIMYSCCNLRQGVVSARQCQKLPAFPPVIKNYTFKFSPQLRGVGFTCTQGSVEANIEYPAVCKVSSATALLLSMSQHQK